MHGIGTKRNFGSKIARVLRLMTCLLQRRINKIMGYIFDCGYRTFCKLERSSWGVKIVPLIRKCKIHVLAHKLLYWSERKHPTEQMIKSREFFKKNQERIKEICSWLADEKSREVYEKIIEFRQYRVNFPSYSEEDIYFVDNIISLDDHAVFVDCGAYTGDTIERLIKKYNRYKKIYALEPDKQNCQELKNKVIKNVWKNIEVHECASWSEKQTLKFTDDCITKTGNQFSENGTVLVNADSIDNILCGGGCDLIKMDVEGAELESLKGAKNTILKYKPQLAICIYHSDEDMLSIAEYIHNLVPEYKMYYRGYSVVWYSA